MSDEEVATSFPKWRAHDFSGFAATNRISMAETLRWFDAYLGDHPEVELVYRRHPSEWNSPALEALAKKRPNFHVIFADSVKQWIVAADSISIWMSTAIAEVYMAGKSCHILRPCADRARVRPGHLQRRAVCDKLRGFLRRDGGAGPALPH